MPVKPAFEVDFGDPTPKKEPPKKKSDSIIGQVSAGFHGELASAIHAARNVSGVADSAARILAKTTGWDITKSTKHIQDTLAEYEASQTRKSVEQGEPTSIVGKVARVAGAVPAQLGEFGVGYALTRRPLAAFALVDASKELDKGLVPAVKAGVIGAAEGAVLGGISKLPFKARVPLGAAAGAASTALQGGSGRDVAVGSITGGAFAALPERGKGQPKTWKNRIDAVTKGPVAMLDDLKKVFAPHLRGGEAGRLSADILREQNAILDLQTRQAQNRAHEAWKFFNTAPKQLQLDVMKAIDTRGPRGSGNNIHTLPAEIQPFAQTLKGILDENRDRLVQRGLLTRYYENYFPHIWKDPRRAAQIQEEMATRRPLGGSGSYKRARQYLTIEDGLSAGLVPAFENPVDMVFAKLRESNKAIMADAVLKEFEQNGLSMKVMFGRGKGKGLPPGKSDWKALGREPADKTFVIYGPPVRKIKLSSHDPNTGLPTTITKNIGTGGVNIVGQWYAPEPVARLINNHLSPGFRGAAIYDNIQAMGNVMNQFQLGLSAFHLGFTSVDSMISNNAVALQYLMRGKPLKAAATAAMAPLSPFRYYLRGNKVLTESLKPGTYSGQIADMVDKIVMGGGRFERDEFYRTHMADQMKNAFARGDIGRGLLKAPFVPVEWISDFIMGRIVPRMKLGALSQMIEMEMATKGPNMTQNELRRAIGSAVDSVDNRMGQVIYDNWFMNRFAKDLLHISMRSVGWNLGTFRELVGGIGDIRKLSKGPGSITHKLAYTVSLPATIAAMGAMWQILSGQGYPTEIKDYFFPKTGRKDDFGNDERISFPSYMKDIVSYYHEPKQTISNKLHPLLGAISEMLNNRDFYGTKIFNEGHPFMLDLAKFAAGQFVPFSARIAEQEAGRGTNPALPFIGITPASRMITQDPAQRLASQYAREQQPMGGRSAETAEHSTRVRDLARKLRNNPEAAEDLRNTIEKGDIGRRDIRNITRESKESALVRAVTTLPLEKAMNVWDKATDKQKRELLPVLMRKVRGLKDMPPNQAKALMERLRSEVNEFREKQQKSSKKPAFEVQF